MKIFVTLLLLLTFVGNAFLQEKQKIPVEFFEGKWAGNIDGYIYDHGSCRNSRPYTPPRKVPFSIEWHGTGGIGSDVLLKPYGVKGIGMLMFLGNMAPNVPIAESGKNFYITPLVSYFSFAFSEEKLIPVTPLTDEFIMAIFLWQYMTINFAIL